MRHILIMAMVALFAFPAQALTIRNITGVSQQVLIERGGNYQEITLQPNQVYYLQGGDITLIMPGQKPVPADFMNEYVIWPNGKLMLQRRMKGKISR